MLLYIIFPCSVTFLSTIIEVSRCRMLKVSKSNETRISSVAVFKSRQTAFLNLWLLVEG